MGLEESVSSSADAPKIKRKPPIVIRVALVVLIILSGIAAKVWLTSLREAPPLVELPPVKVHVEVKAAYPEDCPVVISGYGEVHALASIAVTPKVAGEVTYVHPDLEVGKVIPEGTALPY